MSERPHRWRLSKRTHGRCLCGLPIAVQTIEGERNQHAGHKRPRQRIFGKHRRGECPNSSVEQYKFGFERSWRGVALAKKHAEAIAGQKQRYNQWNLTVTIIGAAAAIIAAAARSGPSVR